MPDAGCRLPAGEAGIPDDRIIPAEAGSGSLESGGYERIRACTPEEGVGYPAMEYRRG